MWVYHKLNYRSNNEFRHMLNTNTDECINILNQEKLTQSPVLKIILPLQLLGLSLSFPFKGSYSVPLLTGMWQLSSPLQELGGLHKAEDSLCFYL